TVGAVILAASPESALADVEGQSRVRRITDAAWSGGALPIVVVSFDPDGAVAASLAGASVTLAEPVPPPDGAPARQMARGIEVAGSLVNDLSGALLWPARMVWVSPETVTSLIEAHGVDRGTILRPSYDGEAGWPVLVPSEGAANLASVAPNRMPDQILADLEAAGTPSRTLELGDPGATYDASVARADLPAYLGPTEPAAPHTHEWGAALADAGEDSPLEGPGLAPYDQAAATE
ncbi:MAG: NTP transferase domain-containing protein, partial [Chloroflexota bacterium]